MKWYVPYVGQTVADQKFYSTISLQFKANLLISSGVEFMFNFEIIPSKK